MRSKQAVSDAGSQAGIPTVGWLRLLGRAIRARSHLEALTSIPAHGDLVRVGLGNAGTYVACTPELVRELLCNDADFGKGGSFTERAEEVVGKNSLTTADRENHRRQRRLVQPAFHKQRLPGYTALMSDEIAALFERFQERAEIDLTVETNTLVAKILAASMFQHEASGDEIGRVIEDIDTLVSIAPARMVSPAMLNRLPTPYNRRYWEARGRLRSLMAAAAEAADRDEISDVVGNLVAILLSTRVDGMSLDHTEIVDQLTLMQIAGVDTTASTLAWALYLVSTHPQVEQRLHAEVDSVLTDGRVATFADMPLLPYTWKVFAETLRMRPAVWFATRTAVTDARLGGHIIPAGSEVAFSPYMLHHRPDLWQRPWRFEPDRFDFGKPPTDIWIPFGGGARRCIGEHFAMAEGVLAVASFAARWRLRPVAGVTSRDPKPRLAASLRPPRLPMTLCERTGRFRTPDGSVARGTA
ncbi:cytochrome P450 [Nocardia terrae]|nr:cytochrome P450 [Nocardia terrae]